MNFDSIIDEIEKNKGLSIVIPALNEPYLPTLIQQLRCLFYNVPHEIIIRDDKGCGNAILAGIRESVYYNILVMDADGSHSPLSAWLIYNHYINYSREFDVPDLIYGYKKHSHDSPFRKFVTSIFDFLARLFVADYPDLMSGFFIFDNSVIEPLPESLPHPKVLMHIIKHNPDIIVEFYGIQFFKRVKGESKLGNIGTAYRILKAMIWG